MNVRRTAVALGAAVLTALAIPAAGWALTGQVTEFPTKTANSGPFGITAGPDGKVWFTEKAAGVARVGRINADGTGADDFAVPGGVAPYYIVTGPDGKLWMTDQGANKVYKVDPATDPPTITPQAATVTAPTGIAVGPENDLWVANMAGGVQRVKLDGTDDGASIPTGAANLSTIAKASDGNMWVTDQNAGLIKIDKTTHTASPVSIGANKAPRGITTGPDGKLYFAESMEEKVGRIDPDNSGYVETSALTGGASDPEGIASGRDGNLYVAVFNTAQIGQVLPSLGPINQFKQGVSGTMGPREIAQGPDGNMWYSNETQSKVGRFTVDAPPTPGGGGTTGGGGTNTTTGSSGFGAATIAQVVNVEVKPSRFRVGPEPTAVSARNGTTISFLLGGPATATLTFEQILPGRKRGGSCVKPTRRNRRARRCARLVVKGSSLTRAGQNGVNSVPFSGRIGTKALRPGRYRVGVTGTNAAGTGLPQYAKFTVLPKARKKR